MNEDAVLNVLFQCNCVQAVHKAGMMCQKARPWLASSLDAVAVVNINICRPNYSLNNEDTDIHVATVQIKTTVGRDSVARGNRLANPHMVVCEISAINLKSMYQRNMPPR